MNNMKDFLNTWSKSNLKEMSKDDIVMSVMDSIPDIVDFYMFKRFKQKDIMEKLYDVMATKKFIKALRKSIKFSKKNELFIPKTITLVLMDLIENRRDQLDEERMTTLRELVYNFMKKDIDKMVKKTGVPEPLALELLSVIPSPDVVMDRKYIFRYVLGVENKLYATADKEMYKDVKLTEQQVKSIFEFLFGKDALVDVYVASMLHKKEFISNWNENRLEIYSTITSMLLTELEEMKKKDLKELLNRYTESRKFDEKKGRDAARRFNLKSLLQEDYPTISKVVSKFAGEELEKYL